MLDNQLLVYYQYFGKMMEKMAVGQNPGTGYPRLHTKMTILLSSFHPFIPLCD